MAYSTATPPSLILPAFAGGGAAGQGTSLWTYQTTDAYTVVNNSGYITNGGALGMKVGDIVLNTNTSASPPTVYSHRVVTVSATYPGAVDLDDGVQIAGTGNAD